MRARIAALFPRGPADFAVQLAIWLGFALLYQIPRGLANRGAHEAELNAQRLMEFERALRLLIEDDLQRAVTHVGGLPLHAVNWTYWLSQFGALSLALLWIYFARNDAFLTVRNWLLATNLIALMGYTLLPLAPPRMFPEDGFVDTLAASGSVNHGSMLVELAANPYAAMPSVHAADALIIGFALATLVRSRWLSALWTLWPSWVWFSVMATGNHFWLDIAAGVAVAFAAGTMIVCIESRWAESCPAVGPIRRW